MILRLTEGRLGAVDRTGERGARESGVCDASPAQGRDVLSVATPVFGETALTDRINELVSFDCRTLAPADIKQLPR